MPPATAPLRLLIIHNHRAAARREERFHAVLARLEAAGCVLDIRRTHAAGDAAALAASARPEAVDMIVVAGGDGTINDTIDGLTPQSPPLGLIPLGTANVLAHEIGLSRDPEAIATCLLEGACLDVHPGLANGKRFMMMASVGFDAHVVSGLDKALKRRIGKLVYAVEAIRQLFRYPCPPLDVRVDGRPVVAATMVAQRGRLYGGRFVLAPAANLGDRLLHATVIRRPGRWAMAGYCLALPLHLVSKWGLVDTVTGTRIEVSGREGDPVQADGDVITHMPVTLTLAETPITLVVPKSFLPRINGEPS